MSPRLGGCSFPGLAAFSATAREVWGLTNLEGKTISAEILDLSEAGMLKVLVKGR